MSLPEPQTPLARGAQAAARRVTLSLRTCPVTRELYGYGRLVLDETATLRRVALFHRGSGRARLSPDEKDAALEILRQRFDEKHGER